MADAETDAYIAQMRKLIGIAKGEIEVENPQLEADTTTAMLESLVSHRGPGHGMTEEQALEIAKLMSELREINRAHGIEPASAEELMPGAERLLNMKPPAQN